MIAYKILLNESADLLAQQKECQEDEEAFQKFTELKEKRRESSRVNFLKSALVK